MNKLEPVRLTSTIATKVLEAMFIDKDSLIIPRKKIKTITWNVISKYYKVISSQGFVVASLFDPITSDSTIILGGEKVLREGTTDTYDVDVYFSVTGNYITPIEGIDNYICQVSEIDMIIEWWGYGRATRLYKQIIEEMNIAIMSGSVQFTGVRKLYKKLSNDKDLICHIYDSKAKKFLYKDYHIKDKDDPEIYSKYGSNQPDKSHILILLCKRDS